MAKTYGGRIRRTGRSAKKRTQRIVAKAKTTSLAGRPGLNVSAAKSSRFFASMPPILRYKTAWYADTSYNIAAGTQDPAYLVYNGYFWIDPLRFDFPVNAGGAAIGVRSWYSAEMKGLFYQYQEARFRTHVFHYDFTSWMIRYVQATSSESENALASGEQPPLQIAVAAVPLSYLRQTANTGGNHSANQAGQLFTGTFDYFSSLTKLPGSRHHVLDNSTKSTCSGSLIIDGYAHNGVLQSMTALNTGWTESVDQPTVSYSYPDPGVNRTVFLVALRFPYLATANSNNRLNLRAAYRMDQHMEFMDKNPAFPYLSGLPQNVA